MFVSPRHKVGRFTEPPVSCGLIPTGDWVNRPYLGDTRLARGDFY